MIGDCPVHIFLQPTNGLTYLNVCFDITQLSEDMKIYVPLFSYIISRYLIAKYVELYNCGVIRTEKYGRSQHSNMSSV